MSNKRPPTPAPPAAYTPKASLTSRGVSFFTRDIWEIHTTSVPRARRWLINFSRLCMIVGQDFMRNRLGLQASALTYITLMSMVPVLALTFSVSKGLGAHQKVMASLENTLAELPPEASEFANQIFVSVDNTNFGQLGIIGLVLLFWTVISVISQIETSFNTIWHVTVPRTWLRRFQAYISIMVVVPIFFLVATSAATVLSSQRIASLLPERLAPFYWIYEAAVGLGGVLSIVIGFSMLYLAMPNTRVRLGAALAGGVLAGLVWYVAQGLFILGVVSVAKYNAIYGTFAAIPIFLLWVYSTWTIILFGAEFSFAVQNRENVELVLDAAPLSFQDREMIGLRMMLEICTAVAHGAPPWHAQPFAQRNTLALTQVQDILGVLSRGGLIAEIAATPGAYLPLNDINVLTPADVEMAFRNDTRAVTQKLFVPHDTPTHQAFGHEFDRFTEALRQTSFAQLARRDDVADA